MRRGLLPSAMTASRARISSSSSSSSSSLDLAHEFRCQCRASLMVAPACSLHAKWPLQMLLPPLYRATTRIWWTFEAHLTAPAPSRRHPSEPASRRGGGGGGGGNCGCSLQLLERHNDDRPTEFHAKVIIAHSFYSEYNCWTYNLPLAGLDGREWPRECSCSWKNRTPAVVGRPLLSLLVRR